MINVVLWRLLRMLFCRHTYDQRAWGGKDSGYLCTKCGHIQWRKGPGGLPPAGIAFGPRQVDHDDCH